METEKNIHKRSLARLMAVQGLYSYELSESGDSKEILSRMLHVEADTDGEEVVINQSPDKKLLKRILEGTIKKKKEIDEIASKYLKKDWKIERMDNLLLSIIRPGIYELMETDTPVAVILDEYINIAHAFYDTQEVGFANALLDSAAKDLRKNG